MRATATLLFLVALAPAARAASVTLAWDPNVEPEVVAYRLYYGSTAGGPYDGTFADEDSPLEIAVTPENAAAPTATLHGIPSCTAMYFVVTAVASGGLESGYSNEVTTTVVQKPADVVVGPGVGAGELGVAFSLPLEANDPGAITGFLLYYDVDTGAPYEGTLALEGDSPIALGSLSRATTLTGLTPGATWHVALAATCPAAISGLSPEASGPAGTASEGEGEGEGDPGEGEGEGDPGEGEGEGDPGEGEGEGDPGEGEGEGEGDPAEGEGEPDDGVGDGGCQCAGASIVPASLAALALLLVRRATRASRGCASPSRSSTP